MCYLKTNSSVSILLSVNISEPPLLDTALAGIMSQQMTNKDGFSKGKQFSWSGSDPSVMDRWFVRSHTQYFFGDMFTLLQRRRLPRWLCVVKHLAAPYSTNLPSVWSFVLKHFWHSPWFWFFPGSHHHPMKRASASLWSCHTASSHLVWTPHSHRVSTLALSPARQRHLSSSPLEAAAWRLCDADHIHKLWWTECDKLTTGELTKNNQTVGSIPQHWVWAVRPKERQQNLNAE